MKKVAFLCCLFCGLITQAIGATYNCKPQYIGDWASRTSNEYLFSDMLSYYDDKIALVCGHKGTDGCKHGTKVFVLMPYYYRGVKMGYSQLYRCDTSGGASWEPMSPAELDKCANKDGLMRISMSDWTVDNTIEDYDIYVPRTGVHGDLRWGWVFYEEPCYVFDGDDDLSPESSEEEPTDTEKTGQGAKQNQPAQTKSGYAGKNLKQNLHRTQSRISPAMRRKMRRTSGLNRVRRKIY